VLFTKAEIEEGLLALVDELVASGVTSAIYVVGGAAIMLHVEREALTNDVDVLYSSAEIRASVRSVGVAKRWPETWLNDAAKMWASHYDGDDDWEIRFTRGDVSVRVAQPLLLLASTESPTLRRFLCVGVDAVRLGGGSVRAGLKASGWASRY
jgi:hypothetical protein